MSDTGDESLVGEDHGFVDAGDADIGDIILSNEAPTDTFKRRELGNEAVWKLSSAKPGNGVEQLRDDNTDTFWQSISHYSATSLS
jgi:hypothetical protein